VRDAVRVSLIAACFLLLGSPQAYGSTGFAFLATTVQVAAAVGFLALSWDWWQDRNDPAQPMPRYGGIAFASIGALLVFAAGSVWLREISIQPASITALRTDARVIAFPGLMFVPVACAFCASDQSFAGRLPSAAAWTALLAVLVFSEPLGLYASRAPMPVYWPLLALLAWFVARGWWARAALAAAIPLVAGAGMIAFVPIVLMAAWRDSRRSFVTSLAIFVAVAAVPLLRGGADGHALQIGAGGTHEASEIIGLTGLLVRTGWSSAVLPVHLSSMTGIYVTAWFALGRGRRPLPWMGLAFLTTVATTPHPSGDSYFDLFVFFVFAALAETRWAETRHTARLWMVTLVGAALIGGALFWREIPRDTDIDVGTSGDRVLLYSGFASDESDGRTFAWVVGRSAEVLVPRRSRREADLVIVCEPHLPTRDSSQQMSVALNGMVLGTVDLHEGWQTVTLPAPPAAWLVGVNGLRLSFTNATSPLEAGKGDDSRKLSVAFDRISVRTR
jgi:hypothetical protein